MAVTSRRRPSKAVVNNNVTLASSSPTREEVRAWIESKHITLWGRSFTVMKEGMDNAIDWFIETVEDFETFRKDAQ